MEWGTPDWPEGMPTAYEYDAVDGGVFRNEPIELVRASMEEGRPEILSPDATTACGSMILLHPSPKRSDYSTSYAPNRTNMLKILLSMIGALMDEANFQENELAEMTSDYDMSRFLIAPVRKMRVAGEDVLATDTFGGFGGILGEEIRLHDFQLGRKNCQGFLKKFFSIPLEKAKDNPIFGADAAKFARDNGSGLQVVSILPLVGTAKENCPMPQWPSFDEEKYEEVRSHVHDTIEKRLSTVMESFAVSLGFFKKGLAGIGWNYVVGKLVDIVTDRAVALADGGINQALDQFKAR